MTTLIELAERVEGASGPDRELDARIAVTIYSDGGHSDPRDNTRARFPTRSDECAPGTYWISAFSGLSLRTAPAYTASLDAAMMLVPGDTPEIKLHMRDGEWRAIVWIVGRNVGLDADAATPALALTAASLRAIAAKEGE